MLRLSILLLLASVLACGSSYDPKYTIPVDSELKPYEAPEEDEVLEQAGLGEDEEDDEEGAAPAEGEPSSKPPSPTESKPSDKW